MRNINVRDLPDPVAQALENMVQALRSQFHDEQAHNRVEKQKMPKDLPLWPGVAPPLEQMRREEIYKNAC